MHPAGRIRTIIVERGPTGLDMQTVNDGQWLRVAEVAPRGRAENAGICIGDVLLSANGVGAWRRSCGWPFLFVT